MVAATQTQIQIQKGTSSSGGGVQGNGNTHGILKLRSPTCPTSSHASRLIAPIPLSGAFARRGIRYSDSTPAIGTEFARGSLDLAQLLNEDDNIQQRELLKELASLVSHRGVVFLRGQKSMTPKLLSKLAIKMGESTGRPNASHLHIHPLSKEFSESGEYQGEKIDSERDDAGRQISFPDEKSELASAGWHTDISFEIVPSDYAFLQLRTLPDCGGDTLWSSMYSAYDALSEPMKRMLEGLTATHDADMFREQADRYGYPLFEGPRGHPDNVGRHLRAVHPVIRTNPVTGWKGLYVNRSFTKRINELTKDESENMLNYLFRHIAENFNYQVRYRWEKDDLAIWDNRSTNHSGIFDFGNAKRSGDRCCSLGEKPYYNPDSKSRKEDLASRTSRNVESAGEW